VGRVFPLTRALRRLLPVFFFVYDGFPGCYPKADAFITIAIRAFRCSFFLALFFVRDDAVSSDSGESSEPK